MRSSILILILFLLCVTYLPVYSQETCKVESTDLIGSYKGECKNGLANGKGEAKGIHYYKGSFKDGKPNGDGILYYGDTLFYDGNFQDGIKEGKGEMHYLRKNKEDSVIKGYWSGDEYRGSKYTTYSFTTTETFDNIDITPSKANGNTVTFEISTTSGLAGGGPSRASVVLVITNVFSPTGSISKALSKYEGGSKSSSSYEIVSFPCKLFGTLSDGNTFQVDLYKSANWKIRIYKNM